MSRKYLVKIEDSILPQSYSFDQLIDAGILDNVDDNIKVKIEGDTVWITARDFPFSDVESVEENVSNTINPQLHAATPSVSSHTNQSRSTDTSCSDTLHPHLNERPQNICVQATHQGEIRPQLDSPSILNKWNWGAFVLSFIWGICNGIYWPLIIIIYPLAELTKCVLNSADGFTINKVYILQNG